MKKEIIISFKNVRKKFKRGRKLYLKMALLDLFRDNSQEDFYALDNINFQIKKGESVGIIGNNGSGKSTILKLMAGVLTPTSGSVIINGQVSPLIELGAGFHPELTGRENIYLSGTILGLSNKEVDEKFDSIVNFSELDDFIDTPVKHYSSGMYMRLGFSIAINVEPDILLIDEILAVGDISFQKKCLKKMAEFHKNGVTIVLISHSLDLVQNFCQRVIILENGKEIDAGAAGMMVAKYRKREG